MLVITSSFITILITEIKLLGHTRLQYVYMRYRMTIDWSKEHQLHRGLAESASRKLKQMQRKTLQVTRKDAEFSLKEEVGP